MLEKRYYTRSSKTKYRTKEQNLQGYYDQLSYKEILIEDMKENPGKHPGALLLDSSLIFQTNSKNYDVKVIQCGDYFQVYYFKDKKITKDKNLEKEKDIKKVDTKYLHKKENSDIQDKIIDIKNIQRSKIQLQRLVKSNEEDFKTFITLTFEDNLENIEQANIKLNTWLTKIRSIKKDFKYVCVPEFQKRGAVHYHLLTNLDIKLDSNIIKLQSGKKCMYDVKYWSYGFTSVFSMKDINVVGYISKYMTKDIDNRLWGKRRYMNSRNLRKPSITYLDTDNLEEFIKYLGILDYDITYKNTYLTKFNEEIEFKEYKKQTSYNIYYVNFLFSVIKRTISYCSFIMLFISLVEL